MGLVNLDTDSIITSGGGYIWTCPSANICPDGYTDVIDINDTTLEVENAGAVQIGVTTGTVELSFDAPIQGIPVNELAGQIKPFVGEAKATLKWNHVQVFQEETVSRLPSVNYHSASGLKKLYGARKTVKSDLGVIAVVEEENDDGTEGLFVGVLYQCYFMGPLIFQVGKFEYAKPALTAIAIPVATRERGDELYTAYRVT